MTSLRLMNYEWLWTSAPTTCRTYDIIYPINVEHQQSFKLRQLKLPITQTRNSNNPAVEHTFGTQPSSQTTPLNPTRRLIRFQSWLIKSTVIATRETVSVFNQTTIITIILQRASKERYPVPSHGTFQAKSPSNQSERGGRPQIPKLEL